MSGDKSFELCRALSNSLSKIGERGVLEPLRDKLLEALKEEFDAMEDQLRDDAGVNIAWHIQSQVTEVVEAIIAGNSATLKRILGLNSSLYDSRSHIRAGAGSYEPKAVEVRRKIVEAHADLFVSEYIKDLEAIHEQHRITMDQFHARLRKAERKAQIAAAALWHIKENKLVHPDQLIDEALAELGGSDG